MPESPTFVLKLKAALEADLPDLLGATVRVEDEPAGTTKLHRFFVYSDGFKDLKHSERQNLVWRIVDRTLDPGDAIKVSMILTLTDEEFGEQRAV